MNEYIEREANKRYCDMDKFAQSICENMDLTEDEANKFISLLWQQPRADVREVEHGEWIDKPEIKSYITTGPRKEMNTLEAIKQLDIIIGTEKALIQHATMGEYEHSQKIEALEIAKKALEKLISKKPKYEPYYSDDEGKWITDDAYCPNCNKHFDMFREFKSYYAKENKCCPSCGQGLDWSDT